MKAGTYHVVDANRIKALQDAIDAIRGKTEMPCLKDAPKVDPKPPIAPPVDVKPMETRLDKLERNIDVILSAIESLQKAELQRQQKAAPLAPKQSKADSFDYESWARARLELERRHGFIEAAKMGTPQ